MKSAKPRVTVPFFRPLIEQDDIDGVERSLRSGWLTTGPQVKEFERQFAATLGVEHAVAVNSCTSGLHAALATLDMSPGDEVITTPYTFVATLEAILLAGGKPVLVDVEPTRLNVDPEQIERAISPRTRGIVPVHIAGHPCEMDRILELGDRSGAAVIDDAAHAYPARYRERPIGTMGRATVFSFYATKNLTTGEGGMITTADEALARRLRQLVLHGMSLDAWKRYSATGSWFYEVTEFGFKYNLSDLLASLGLSQLAKMERLGRRRREIVDRFREGLGSEPAFELPGADDHVEHAWHLYLLRLNPAVLSIDRDEFIRQMAELGVSCSVHFIPAHLHPYYRDRLELEPDDLPVAHREYRRCLSLPLFPAMTDEEIDHVVSACLQLAARYRR